MNILVLSDLHIDNGDKYSVFQWDQLDFIKQVELLRDIYSIDKIIFNGDTFELLKYSFEEIRKANPILLRYLKDKDFVFIKGNHDRNNNFGLKNYRITNSKGQIIYFEHGHKADWFNSSRFGNVLGETGLVLLRKFFGSTGIMNLYLKLLARLEKINSIPKRYDTLKYLTYALKLLKDNDVVILSHTHKLESHHTYYLRKKKRYLNSGSCSLGRFEGIIMNTESLQYEMIKETKNSVFSHIPVSFAI
jgi:predicted phosphodiesterase